MGNHSPAGSSIFEQSSLPSDSQRLLALSLCTHFSTFESLHPEIYLQIYKHYWSFGSLKFQIDGHSGAPNVQVLNGECIDLGEIRRSMALFRKLETRFYANNSSSENLEALTPIFHMNVSHKELLETGYTADDVEEKRFERFITAANFVIGKRDPKEHRKNFENARGRYYILKGEILHFGVPSK
ncbi:hypothetical protein EAF04_003152 [Stromatinia cepivora]|nr:hypothetical protein EAF04_003152 [Stromatinia cepivora]